MDKTVRRKTAMVLHQIEESLGNFVLNNGNVESLNAESLEVIHKREVDKGRGFSTSSIKDIVEATYLDELFRFAIDIAKESSIVDSLNYMYSLFHQLDIYEIRNAISHPNRPFWDCYWYRVAAIASDPVNEILGLKSIKEALVSAEQGQIEDVPEEWVNKIIWQIPNNLPSQFDHGLTGLIGRSKEVQELQKYISNPRINNIALVAPGGAGKTALALDLLNGIVSSPTYTKYIDAVLYATMKTEKLTSEGVISLNSIETISELRNTIIESINHIFSENHESFESVLSGHDQTKILICIDNLETLLRDNPDSFEELNHSLPPCWRVLVTSRIAISNATILGLDALKEKSAIHLARTYLTKRGGLPLDENSYSRLTKGCFYNPLAIRLTIDLIITGKEIPDSLNVANKEISEFSYNNLIGALSDTAVEILEAVFVEDASTRLSLCELLDLSLDEISSAIGELSRTSLISRKSTEQGELYGLSDSVRDLLVISPRNISTRTRVQDRINKRRVLSNEIDIKQDVKDLPEWNTDFIPKNTNENLKILLTEVYSNLKKANRDTEVAVRLYRKLKDAQFMYESSYLFHKAFARVSDALKDFSTAEKHFKQAIGLNGGDPSTRYLLARLYHNNKRYDDAHEVYSKLIHDGWAEESKELEAFGKSIYEGYFLALLYTGRYEEVLSQTKKWKDFGLYRGLLGTYRASAWKRKMENLVNDDPENTVIALIKASRILNDVFRNNGYFKAANNQTKKIFEEIEFCFSREDYCTKYPIEGQELIKFVAENIMQISDVDDNLIKKLSVLNIEGNPFKSDKWSSYSHINQIDDEFDELELRQDGLIMVKITHRPKDKASFLFAEDGAGLRYFLHYDNFKNGNWKDWSQLSIGYKLDIHPDKPVADSLKAITAKEIYLTS